MIIDFKKYKTQKDYEKINELLQILKKLPKENFSKDFYAVFKTRDGFLRKEIIPTPPKSRYYLAKYKPVNCIAIFDESVSLEMSIEKYEFILTYLDDSYCVYEEV